MTDLRSALEKYLSMRKGLGYKFEHQTRRLGDFVAFTLYLGLLVGHSGDHLRSSGLFHGVDGLVQADMAGQPGIPPGDQGGRAADRRLG